MLIFTVPKAFEDIYDKIQRRALESWLKITDHIVLFGDENGVAEVAKEYNVKHIADIEKSVNGVPVLNDMFAKAFPLDDIKCYVNADIILSGIDVAVGHVKDLPKFLVVGRRHDLIYGELQLHTPDAVDYFLYRGILEDKNEIPPFLIGRCFWDDWIVAHYLEKDDVYVVDGTPLILAVHQDHPMNGAARIHTPEAQENLRLSEGKLAFPTNAPWVLTEDGLCDRLSII